MFKSNSGFSAGLSDPSSFGSMRSFSGGSNAIAPAPAPFGNHSHSIISNKHPRLDKNISTVYSWQEQEVKKKISEVRKFLHEVKKSHHGARYIPPIDKFSINSVSGNAKIVGVNTFSCFISTVFGIMSNIGNSNTWMNYIISKKGKRVYNLT